MSVDCSQAGRPRLRPEDGVHCGPTSVVRMVLSGTHAPGDVVHRAHDHASSSQPPAIPSSHLTRTACRPRVDLYTLSRRFSRRRRRPTFHGCEITDFDILRPGACVSAPAPRPCPRSCPLHPALSTTSPASPRLTSRSRSQSRPLHSALCSSSPRPPRPRSLRCPAALYTVAQSCPRPLHPRPHPLLLYVVSSAPLSRNCHVVVLTRGPNAQRECAPACVHAGRRERGRTRAC